MKLSIGQINARHSMMVWQLLEESAQSRKLDVVAVQEPPVQVQRDTGKWGGYDILYPRGTLPLVALAVRSNLKFEPVWMGGNRLCGVLLECSGFSLIILSAYLRHTTGEGHAELSHAFRVLRDRCGEIILCADCNGHSPLWGPSNVVLDAVGRKMEDIIAQENLFVLNHSDSPSTFRGDNGQESWIDVTAATPNLLPKIVTWGVNEDMEVGSDHLPITTVISVAPIRSEVRRVRDWKNVDWKSFNATLLWRLGRLQESELQTKEDVDAAVAHLTEGLQYAIDECVPIKRLCSYSRTGWTPEVKALHRVMIDRRRRWVRFRKVADRERYLQSRSRFRRCLKENRRAAWRQLCSSTTSADYWSLYKKVNRAPGSHRVEELTHDG